MARDSVTAKIAPVDYLRQWPAGGSADELPLVAKTHMQVDNSEEVTFHVQWNLFIPLLYTISSFLCL